jgi:ABC-type branched-subunit amino acid transport system ATPase component
VEYAIGEGSDHDWLSLQNMAEDLSGDLRGGAEKGAQIGKAVSDSPHPLTLVERFAGSKD